MPTPEIYRKLLETAPDALIVSDTGGHIVFVNAQGERMFGYENGELIGQPIEALVPERLRGGHRTHRSNYVRQPSARPMGVGMTLVAVTKSGREFPVEISLSPAEVDGTVYVCAAIRDVSRLQSARDAMTRAHYQAHVAELGQRVIAVRDLDEVAAAVPGIVARALGADVVLLYLLGGHDTEFVCRGSYGVPADLQDQLKVANYPGTAPGFVLAAGDSVIVTDYATEARFDADPAVRALGLVCALGVPIVGDEGPVGVLTARYRTRRAFSEDDNNF
ncbi:MAG: PAS domain S-box protein, partial [Betaproteobacteria bacterium]